MQPWHHVEGTILLLALPQQKNTAGWRCCCSVLRGWVEEDGFLDALYPGFGGGGKKKFCGCCTSSSNAPATVFQKSRRGRRKKKTFGALRLHPRLRPSFGAKNGLHITRAVTSQDFRKGKIRDFGSVFRESNNRSSSSHGRTTRKAILSLQPQISQVLWETYGYVCPNVFSPGVGCGFQQVDRGARGRGRRRRRARD